MPNRRSDLLYHYTDQRGLIGILETRTLWLGHIHYLNDSKELWHAFDVARDRLRLRLGSAREAKLKKKLNALLNSLDTLVHSNELVGSFSESGDSLSQWRAYARGAGYSIGIYRAAIDKLTKTNAATFKQCVYSPQKQLRAIDDLIEKALPDDGLLMEPVYEVPGTNQIFITSVGSSFAKDVTALAPFLKHDSFQDEKEWRLLIKGTSAEKLRHRAGTSMLVPYYEFPLGPPNQWLARIVIGPNPHPELSKMSVWTLLGAAGFTNNRPEIVPSRLPFRSW